RWTRAMDSSLTAARASPAACGTLRNHRRAPAPLRGASRRARRPRGPAAWWRRGRPCRAGIDCVTMPAEDAMDPVLSSFLDALVPERGVAARGREQDLAALLQKLCGQDRSLAAALAARLPEGDVLDALARIHVDDVRLVCAALAGDSDALARLDTLLGGEV